MSKSIGRVIDQGVRQYQRQTFTQETQWESEPYREKNRKSCKFQGFRRMSKSIGRVIDQGVRQYQRQTFTQETQWESEPYREKKEEPDGRRQKLR